METKREENINQPIGTAEIVISREVIKTRVNSGLKLSIFLLVSGMLLIVLSLVLLNLDYIDYRVCIGMSILGSGTLGEGLAINSMVRSSIKNADYIFPVKYTFYDNYFMTQCFKDGEIVSWSKTTYEDCISFCTIKEYIYIISKRKSEFVLKFDQNIIDFLISKGIRCTNLQR